MTGQDRALFAEAMLALGETFNEPISDVRSEAYFDALRDCTIEEVNAAVRLAIGRRRFFPKPVELRELVFGDPEVKADRAWAELVSEVRRTGYMGEPMWRDPMTLRTIRDVWGSWRRLCETLPSEGPELVGWTKQFKSAYRSINACVEHERLTSGMPIDLRQRLTAIANSHALPGARVLTWPDTEKEKA